ncbi:MAG: hypothetical protein HC851_08375 [Acaryochloris sp. RU_4_1]|nr:hypothetical protein [Acaryochloris sp. RU_4_1]NJN37733.1 hypothetical protein [Acaryochloridaceae cyanobacterium CSU_3_4]
MDIKAESPGYIAGRPLHTLKFQAGESTQPKMITDALLHFNFLLWQIKVTPKIGKR